MEPVKHILCPYSANNRFKEIYQKEKGHHTELICVIDLPAIKFSLSLSGYNQSCCWISRVVLPAEYWWNFIALVGSGVGRKKLRRPRAQLGFISIYRVGLCNSLVQLDAGSDKKKEAGDLSEEFVRVFLWKKNHVFSFLFGVMSLLSCMWMSTFACKEEEHRWIDTRDFGVYTFFSTHVYRPMMTANAPIHGGSTLLHQSLSVRFSLFSFAGLFDLHIMTINSRPHKSEKMV